MVAGGLPTIQVLLDDGSGAFPYDVTSRVRLVDGIRISRGRDDEQSDVTAGQCSAVFDNTDAGFTPGSTLVGSPSPITIDNRLRVKYTVNATVFNRHTGYLTSDPVAWPTGGDQESRVSATFVDAQARAERRTLLSVIQEEVLADAPSANYMLSEPTGATTAADSSGNQHSALQMAGVGPIVTFGNDSGLSTDALTAGAFFGGQYLTSGTFTYFWDTFLGAATTVTAAFFTSASGTAATIAGTISGGSAAVLGIDSTGHLTTGLAGGLTSTATVNDGALHVASVSIASGGGTNVRLYLDGVQVASGADGGGKSGPLTVGVSFIGTISQVSVGSGSATRILAYSNAMLNGFAGESGTTRITRLAGYAGVPIGTLDTSLTNVGFVDTSGSSDWDATKSVVTAEVGTAYVNGSGSLDFHNRNRPVGKTSPDATVAAEFLAEDTSFATDTLGVLNYFETTSAATGVIQVVRNTTSELGDGTVTHPGHGRYPGSATYLVTTDAEALDRANWIVANHAEPQPRAGTLTLDLLTMTAAQQAACLALEADSWLRITGLPSQTPGGTTGDFVVEGLVDTLTLTSWTLALNVVSRSLFTAWILENATYGVLGSTTRVYI